ncbi:MAG: PAS domain S-box protein, partial [Microcystis sp. M57BS1]|nr:PAS domain S-box protein [Microcystis sp. M57BS1]
RKKAEQKILESKQRYEYVTRATYDAVWDWDILNNKIDWGENYYRIFGLMEEKDSSDFNQFLFRIHPDEKDYFTESIQESILSNAYNWELEHRFLKSDGRYAYVANNAMIIRNIDGKALRIIGAMQDITRRKEEERHLRLLESVITNTDDAILITDAEPLSDPGPKIVYVNEAFTRMTGYKVNEVIGKTPRILQGPKSDKVELSRLSKALRNWEPCEITTINYRKNGEEFWINFSISPVADETGWYTHWIAIERDVTERKIQELQKQLLSDISDIFGESLLLKEILAKVLCKISDFAQFSLSECWLSSTDRVKINHIAKYSKKPEFDYFFNNSNAVKTLSINEGLVGLAWSKGVVHFWEDLYSIDQFTRKAEAQSIGLRSAYSIPLVNNQEVLGVFVFWICDEFVINSHLNELFMNLGGYIGAEVKRKQLEEDLSRLFNLAPDIICILSTDGYFKKFNPALCKMLGYTEDELMEIPYDALVHPEDISTIIEQKELIRAGKQILLYENRLINKLGKYMWISWTATPLLEENLIFAIGKNITKGKELQQLLDSATTLACIGGWEVDMVNNSLFWSDITREIHEVSNDFIPDLESSMLFYIEEHQPIIRKVFSDAMLHGIPYDIEIQMVTARFNKKWVRLIGQAEFINHKCIRIYGSCQDINSQKINALTLTRTLQEKNSILESIGDAFFAVDQSYKITYWNRMAEQLFGKSRDEILGQYLADLYGKEFEGQYRCFFELTMSSKTSHHFETRYESMNAWHEISIYPSDSGFSVYTKDVSYRKNAEKEIQESNERFNLSARATSDIIWDRDIKKNITIRNSDNINKLLGYTKSVSQSPEFDWFALVHSEDRDRMIHYINSVLNDPSQYFMEYGYRLKRQDESYAYLFDKAYIIRDESGTPVRIIGSTQDITRIKENEVQLKKRADELAVSNLELEQFAFVASHDLQEPLRMITSFLTQLDNKYNDILDEKAKKYIFFAVDGAKRMRQIIMDLLEYSRVGRIESALEEIDLVVLISEIEILLQKKVKEKNASIYYHNLPVIYSYKSPIRQVFQNLISNALKYSKVVIPVEIVIKCSAEKEYWKFSVADNGIGIHSEYFDKIFLLFQRLHARSEYSGTGIGLTVSKKIIDNLGGEIWVESEEGKGSIFYFTLPRN